MLYYPQYQMRRGHPPLIRYDLAEEILAYDDPGGLRALLKRHQNRARNVSVEDPFILLDVDTREDLIRLKEQYQKR